MYNDNLNDLIIRNRNRLINNITNNVIHDTISDTIIYINCIMEDNMNITQPNINSYISRLLP